ncbi:glutamate--tRNA ligase family protein [Desulfobotulus sp. H1]|uniref:Glutamate--tRNA ligase family protein n=1 Tax=Desulfobotulus pelophilus TaxID=2823377 RepID=A0ABT3N5W2_9BACT|nr:glutamate--tRNA ligase family protein [Desulfobotulus pelophilus]MCW7752843.1 glutamate--tRNA ligase family protein [Desulfobotulus pelophilus]
MVPHKGPLVSRLAPTPSGFLHAGNALNFIVTWLLVRKQKGLLNLRIDDMDGIRTRWDVVEDIFYSLEWLGLDWDGGPAGPDDFFTHFSLMHRMDEYRCTLDDLMARGQAYCCDCSRKSVAAISFGRGYPGLCREREIGFLAGKTSVRLRVPEETRIRVADQDFWLDRCFGDFVLWRKENFAAYQLASVLEDSRMGVNCIVRGADLMDSTAAQLFLADRLGLQSFPDTFFLHHGLILGDGGEKLSKSRGAYALNDMRESGASPSLIFTMVASFLNLRHDGVSSLRVLQELFDESFPYPESVASLLCKAAW